MKDKKEERTCITCGNKFFVYIKHPSAGKYCSRKCYRASRTKIEIICKVCGNIKLVKLYEVERGQHKYCSWNCYKIDHPRNTRKRVGNDFRRCRKAFKRDNYICQLCGSNAEIVHHIIPFRDFKENDDPHKLNNLISLCINCHKLTYNKEYEMADMFKRILENRGEL